MIRVLTGAVVTFATDSINAAHDVVSGWILSCKENRRTVLEIIKRTGNLQPVGCLRSLRLSTGIASTSHVTPRA